MRPPHRRTVLAPLAGVGALVLAAGLASCSSTAPKSPDLSVPPSGTSPTTLVLPVERYLFSQDQTDFLNAVVYDEARSCMSGLGFALPSLPLRDTTGTAGLVGLRYGPSDPATAARLGYHLATTASAHAAPAQPPSTADERAAYFGTSGSGPRGGCHGQAAASVAGAATLAESPVAQQIKDQGYTESLTDPRVVHIVQAWSQCMKTKGYTYADPEAAYSDARWRTSAASATEIRTAVADVACKQQTNLVGVWFAVESAYENTRMAQQSTDLAAELAAKDSELRDATAYAASSGLIRAS